MKATLKSTLCFLGISLGGFALFALACEDDCRIPNGREEGWPVVFEDTGLSPKEKQAIIDDYRNICSQLSPQGSHETKTLEGQPVLRMTYGNEYWHVPDAISGHVGLLREVEGGNEVAVVDQAMSDAYKKALANKNAYREAYDCLPAFVNLMNNLNEEDLPETLSEIVYFAKDAKRYENQASERTIREFVDSLGRHRYEMPSILDMEEFEGLPRANVGMYLYGEQKHFFHFPVVFEGGRWKMLVPG
ncbi:MAG: hypothetical protein J5615_09685 [Fibrobacter sp.]|nr:hypothetical protein [Fibrobacter sp.]